VLAKLGHIAICSVDTVCFANGRYVDPMPRSGAIHEERRVLILLHIKVTCKCL